MDIVTLPRFDLDQLLQLRKYVQFAQNLVLCQYTGYCYSYPGLTQFLAVVANWRTKYSLELGFMPVHWLLLLLPGSTQFHRYYYSYPCLTQFLAVVVIWELSIAWNLVLCQYTGYCYSYPGLTYLVHCSSNNWGTKYSLELDFMPVH